MEYYKYGEKEIEYLTKKDKKLGAYIAKVGMLQREVRPDLFYSLMNSVIAQQVAKKAAATVNRRFEELVGEVTPQNVAKFSAEQIQKCGMSLRKANYIVAIAKADIDYTNLHLLSEEEITKQLIALPGIGIWTVEMLMLFCLQKPDVVSWGDFAIRKGMMVLYNKKELTKEQFMRYKKRYSPYGSVASLYLWHISHGDTEGLI